MTTSSYPLFIPPDNLGTKSRFEWTRKEARRYFDWYMEALPHRVAALLNYFRVDRDAFAPRDLLLHLGERVAQVLPRDEFSRPGTPDEFSHPDIPDPPKLTNAGYALAADMGLLTAQILLEQVGDKVSWDIVRKPKRDVNYNFPVMIGINEYHGVDPIGISIGSAASILRGESSSDEWADLLDTWLAMVANRQQK